MKLDQIYTRTLRMLNYSHARSRKTDLSKYVNMHERQKCSDPHVPGARGL